MACKHRVVVGMFLVLVSPGVVRAQDTVESLRAEMAVLQQHMQSLEQRLRKVEAAEGKPAPQAAASAPRPAQPAPVAAQASATEPAPATRVTGVEQPVLPVRESVSDPSLAASRVDNQAPPTNPDLDGYIAIPGTETMIRLGGYAKLDAIYDNRKPGDADQFITAEIPVSGTPGSDVSNFNLHAKQTRFSFTARRPTSSGNLRFYLENDFFGSGDSYQFRLRHAFGQIGNTYAGYGYSTFMDPDALPDTLDFEGPGSAPYLLVAGIHQAFPFGKGNSFTVAVEDPDSQVQTTGSDDSQASRLPDLSLALRMERSWGHLQLSGVMRQLGYVRNDDKHTAFGGGLSLTGSVATGERDMLLFGVHGGSGLARYIADTGGSDLDAVIGPDGRLHVLDSYGGYFAYTHYWTSRWRSNLVYGQLHLEGDKLLADDAFHASRYGAANLIWSPAPSWTMGMELLYGRHETRSGASGDAMRLQGSVQYNFIK